MSTVYLDSRYTEQRIATVYTYHGLTVIHTDHTLEFFLLHLQIN